VNVVDASVVVELVLGRLDPTLLGDEELAVPHLLDSEVTNVLRRLASAGAISRAGARHALDAFLELLFLRFPAAPLRERMWELRDNLSGYDATYVALAESIGAVSLLTADRRVASAPGLRCLVTLV
jgi:predicted nucleic acid-binding protein